jgi:protein TonB
MNVKKSKNADLERKRFGFGILGAVIAGSMVLLAFTYKSIEIKAIAFIQEDASDQMETEIIEEFEIPDQQPPPEPPPPQAPPPIVEEIKEVEDDVEVKEIDQVNPDDIEPEDDFTEEEEIKPPVIHDVVGVSPEYPGGPAEMAGFIQQTFEYPEMAREMGEQGTIWVEFVVFSDGSIKQVKVVKGVSAALDKEAMRVVKKMPNWTPGEQAGKPVNVRYTIPIKARLG